MKREDRDYWTIAQVGLTVGAIVFAIVIPLQIEGSQRRLQNQGYCINSLLALRRDLASFYDLGDDGSGNVRSKKFEKDPDMEQDRISDMRRTAQNARDTVYVLCRELGGNRLFVNPEVKPWIDSPAETSESWARKNVSDILRESSTLIGQMATIKPSPIRDWAQLFR